MTVWKINSGWGQPATSCCTWLTALCVLLSPGASSVFCQQTASEVETAATTPLESEQAAIAFLNDYCLDCHAANDPQAGLNLAGFSSAAQIASDVSTWKKVAHRVHDSLMPPVDSQQPSTQQRKEFVRWLRQTMTDSICGGPIDPGPPRSRRLSRFEYSNSVRDLLGIPVNFSALLPDEGAGGEGFDNAAETLFISATHAEKYIAAARVALDYAVKDPPTRQALLVAFPTADRTADEAAREVLQRFLPRAFRRPVADIEVDEYLQLFRDAINDSVDYMTAIQYCLEAALVSPKFLFLNEAPCNDDQMQPVADYEMASRLSYFLWGTMPDAELLQLAQQGQLHDSTVLRQQVSRMLHSPLRDDGIRPGARVRDFVSNFVEQWLGTRALGREFQPDPSIARRFDSELVGAMKYEPILFMEELLSENRSLLEIVDADFTYVNRQLARHYRVSGEFREQPKRVSLTVDDKRGGVLAMGAVLAISSLPHRTSPVLRGKWILESLLGTPPPPPPPGVPPLESPAGEVEKPTTLRERLERHRADPACAGCHNMMDPLGFGLENYDVLGRWRTKIDDHDPVDARGQLADGQQFDGPVQLKQVLMERKQQIARNFTSKMLGYALSRQLTDHDHCTVESIVARLEADDYKMQTLVFEIVTSLPFRYKMNSSSAR
ncbi:MAG: DUF1592 domain-containing protein [Pirellulaceae bacterium]|nr:DUF1592 domain-containing protein [Pirellulaceae bacterium]